MLLPVSNKAEICVVEKFIGKYMKPDLLLASLISEFDTLMSLSLSCPSGGFDLACLLSIFFYPPKGPRHVFLGVLAFS